MSDEIVKIKGAKTGLQLTFAQGATFADIEAYIRDKLETNESFFKRGTMVQVAPDALNAQNRAKLKKLFNSFGLLFTTTEPSTNRGKTATVREPEVEEMVVINRTVRGGQEIKTKSSVMICGNVNPGAQIIAGGSIDIRGTCRGIVHAGAYGNTKAFIIADRLLPLQIRIANVVARPPDQMEESGHPEKAIIKDGQIVIEPIDR